MHGGPRRLCGPGGWCWSLFALLVLALPAWQAARAGPPALPSSFWGSVTLADGTDAPVGLVVRALVGDQPCAETRTREYEGRTMYTLHVPAEDGDTPDAEGGQAGDAVRWEVCSALLQVSSVWQGGTNVRLDLQVPASADCDEPAGHTPAPPSAVASDGVTAGEARSTELVDVSEGELSAASPLGEGVTTAGEEDARAAPPDQLATWAAIGGALAAGALVLAIRRMLQRV